MRPGDIHERIEQARALYRHCTACAWRCGVNRLDGEHGFCGLLDGAHLGRSCVSVGEEAALSPSHLVYLTGCSLRCVFCLSGEMVDAPRDFPSTTPRALLPIVEQARDAGAKNLNLLGGDPSVNVLAVLELVAEMPADIPVVWNSNFFHSPELHALVDGVVDVWLPDLKFGNDACAQRLAKVPDYVETVQQNLRRVHRSGQRMVVRHVLMPGHVACCSEPVAAFLSTEMPQVEVSLVTAFLPLHHARQCSELLAAEDLEHAARQLVEKHGLRRVHARVNGASPTRNAGYAGTIFVGADGSITLMDPSASAAATVDAITKVGPAS